MKKMKRIVAIAVLLIVLFAIINCNNVSATFNMMETINNQVNATADTNVTDSVKSIAGSVITITKVICAGVAVAMLTILGIKYMSAAPGEKADIKKHAVPYVVGAVIMFGCTGILSIIEKFASGF
jgi:predicted membrane channel-forming protein YqfA (hemolysin III family)